MKVLISNDDGIHAPGIHALALEFSKFAEVTIVAPERERSTTGHYLTLHKPLRLHKFNKGIYSLSGGPADCILFATHELFKGKNPDLVVSGINNGANLGQDVFYSGTASAAREGANLGIPAMAVSLSLDKLKKGGVKHFNAAAHAARVVLQQVLPVLHGKKESPEKMLRSWPKNMMLNVNVPNLASKQFKGYMPAVQGFRIYGTNIVKRMDARVRDYYWLGGNYEGFAPIEDSDCVMVDKGYVSITPMQIDTTMKNIYHSLQNAYTVGDMEGAGKKRKKKV